MDSAALIALITTLVVSIVGNIAAWWQIAAQTKKDKRQADIDEGRLALEKDKAESEKENEDRAGLLAVAESLRLEVERLQKRCVELENTVIAKTTEIGELKLADIDKEAEIRKMKYSIEAMQARLSAMPDKPMKGYANVLQWKTDLLSLFPTDISSDMLEEEDQKKKDMITESINMELEELREDSISSGLEEASNE